MNFKEYKDTDLKQLSSKGGKANRSPELRWAWANADKLREEHKTVNMAKLAEKYKVNVRSLQRIIRGK